MAPVAGGYVEAAQGWRWAFWYSEYTQGFQCVAQSNDDIVTIFLGITTVLLLCFLEETKYQPTTAIHGISMPISSQEARQVDPKTDDLRAHHSESEKLKGENCPAGRAATEKGDSTISTQHYDASTNNAKRVVEIDHSIPMYPWRQRLALWTVNGEGSPTYSWWRHLWQPFAVLFFFPAAAFAAIQYAFCLAALSVVAVTQSDLYPSAPYYFSAAGVGNLNIPPAIGGLLGAVWGGFMVDKVILWASKRNGGVYEPEMRLYMFALPGLLMPIGSTLR